MKQYSHVCFIHNTTDCNKLVNFVIVSLYHISIVFDTNLDIHWQLTKNC